MNNFGHKTWLLKNGRIHTLEGTTVSAMGVNKGRIVTLGNDEEVMASMGPNVETVDLGGKTVLPGFNDSHMHIISYGFQKHKVCLEKVNSVEGLISAGKQHLAQHTLEPGQWLEGWGWNQNYFDPQTLPTKSDLDQISTEVPIMFTRICCHMACVNSKALALVSEQLGDVFKAELNNDGILREGDLDVFSACMPKPTGEQIKAVILSAIEDAVAVGLTSVQTSDLHGLDLEEVLTVYKALDEEQRLKVRVNLQLYLPKLSQLKDYLHGHPEAERGSSHFLKHGPLKLLLDGSLGARTAALKQDYADDVGNKGLLTYTDHELEEMVELAHSNGLQLSLHAIGDRTLEQALSAIEKAATKFKRQDHRHRINHCQIADLPLIEKMSELGVMADVQPIFVASDWGMVTPRVGEERARYSYAWKSLMKAGVRLAGGSDCPIEPFNPIKGIYAAVTRKDLEGNPLGGWHPDEKLTLDEALDLFTKGSAYATFEEEVKGALAVGKFADFVVLSEDPYAVEEDALKDLKVLATYVNGKAVYGRLG